MEYQVIRRNTGEVELIDSPAELPDPAEIEAILEPWMKLQIFTPEEYYGVVMDLVMKRRGSLTGQDHPAPGRVVLPSTFLAEMIVDFYDKLKSSTRGYASMDYEFDGYRASDLVKLEVLVNKVPVDALAMIVHEEDAYHRGAARHPAQEGDSPPALRGADPGCRRASVHQPGHGEGAA